MNITPTKRKVSLLGLTQVVAVGVMTVSIPTICSQLDSHLELLSHFRLQYFYLSLLCTLLFLAYCQYKSSLVMALVFLLNSIYIIPWYFNESTDDNYLASLKIIHSNVHTTNSDYQKFIALIEREKPDIVVVQELSHKWLNQLAVVKNIYPHIKAKPSDDNFGIAIFSKFPLENVEEMYWGLFDIPSLKVDFTLSGTTITLISSHPPPPINRQLYIARNTQLNEIARVVTTINNPIILIGDLNVSMWSADYQKLERETGLKNARKGFGILPTWPTQLPVAMIPIDHCLLSSAFNVDDIRNGEDIGSDHLPLVMTLLLKTK